MKSACSRLSSVSCAWKATASRLPSRIAIGCPSTSARTSTPGPCSSTHGARIETPRGAAPPPGPRSRCRPRSCGAVGERMRCGGRRSRRGRGDRNRKRSSPRSCRESASPPGEGPNGPIEALSLHPLRDRRRLPTGNHEAIEALGALGGANLDGVGAERLGTPKVGREVALNGETPIRRGASVKPRGPA